MIHAEIRAVVDAICSKKDAQGVKFSLNDFYEFSFREQYMVGNGESFETLSFFGKNDSMETYDIWVVVLNIFYFQPCLGKIPNLTNIFQRG